VSAVTVHHADDGKDEELSADIRLLGRMLGDVVRVQAGDEVFALVEEVRRRAVDARRDGRSSLDALAATLPERSIDDQLHLIRAFGWLSLLANTSAGVGSTGSGDRAPSRAASPGHWRGWPMPASVPQTWHASSARWSSLR
jgi:phosphoenolpyruvate carboxylase